MERTVAWLTADRRLSIRDERDVEIHRAFLDLACAIICFNYVRRFGRVHPPD